MYSLIISSVICAVKYQTDDIFIKKSFGEFAQNIEAKIYICFSPNFLA